MAFSLNFHIHIHSEKKIHTIYVNICFCYRKNLKTEMNDLKRQILQLTQMQKEKNNNNFFRFYLKNVTCANFYSKYNLLLNFT